MTKKRKESQPVSMNWRRRRLENPKQKIISGKKCYFSFKMSFCSQQISIYIRMTTEVIPLRYNVHSIFDLLPKLNLEEIDF